VQIDSNGKTVIPANAKRTLENGVETITYKVLNGTDNVTNTVVITRDQSGKLVSVARQYDMAYQVKTRKMYNISSTDSPLVKSAQSDFAYSGDECSVNQTMALEMENEKSKEVEKKVYYDKKFCDQLAPTISRIGAQNATQCGSLIDQAKVAFDSRNKDLASEGKSLKTFSYFGETPSSQKTYATTFNLGMAIQSCVLMNGAPLGMMGGMVGFAGGGMMMGGPYGGSYGGGLGGPGTGLAPVRGSN
jgi:hypothetical protein